MLTTVAALARSRRSLTPAAAQDIKFSLQLPLTGPVAFTGQLNQAGWQHAIDWINKNGGVKGRKLDPYIYDSEYKVDVGIAGWKKAIANGDMVFSVGDGTPFVRAVTPENNDRYKIMMTNTGLCLRRGRRREIPVPHHARPDLFGPDRHPLPLHQGQAGLRPGAEGRARLHGDRVRPRSDRAREGERQEARHQHRRRGRNQVERHRRDAARHQAAQCRARLRHLPGLCGQSLARDREARARLRHQGAVHGHGLWRAARPDQGRGPGGRRHARRHPLRDDGRGQQRLGHEGDRRRR